MDDVRLKILVVEDDEVDRMALERAVRQQELPYKIETAGSVAEASAALSRGEYDAVLLDYNLGDGTALDVLDLDPEAPVIVITGTNQIDVAVDAMKAGAFDYLVKDQERDYLLMLPLAVDSAIRRKEEEERSVILSHAVMSAGDAIFITDLEGTISFANSAVTRIYGYPVEDVFGRPISIIGPIGPDGEYRHRRADGSELPVLVTRSAVRDERGREVATVVMARDITEAKKAEEDLRRTNEELEGYAHTVSHDLKGPLASMMLAASTLDMLLAEEGVDVKKREISDSLDVINNSIEKSTSLIEDLLSLAEAGQKPVDVEVVDVDLVVARILDENSSLIGNRGAVVAAEGDLGRLRASPTHVYQLFANLISNCLKHCDCEPPSIEVRRLPESGDGLHRYLVRDNGSGIPEEDLRRIFDPFFKGSAGGTGIGLATVDKIVNLYGGEIRAYNDGGACFEFSIADVSG